MRRTRTTTSPLRNVSCVYYTLRISVALFFFLMDTAPPETYPLPLPAALPILLTELTLPGGGKLGVSHPRHARPPAVGAAPAAEKQRRSAKKPAKRAQGKLAKKPQRNAPKKPQRKPASAKKKRTRR